MAIATVTNFNPSASTITVAEYITAEAITSIINISKGLDIYVIGYSSLVSAVYDINIGTLITIGGALTGSEATDIVVVRYSGKGIYIKPDWNATPGSSAEILNQPTLGTAALADANDFATPAQGQLAESALQPESIGDTVQPFDPDTVIDPDYNQFTDAEKTKLASLGTSTETFIFILSPPGVDATLNSNVRGLPAMPYNFEIDSIRLDLDVAPVGANFIVDCLNDGVSVLTSLLMVDDGELSSTTSATPPALATDTLPAGSKLSFRIDQIGVTAKGQYAVVSMTGRRV
jgi:hypothetical protein